MRGVRTSLTEQSENLIEGYRRTSYTTIGAIKARMISENILRGSIKCFVRVK